MEKLKKLEKTGNLDLCVGSKYRLERKIGSGGLGAVYLGLDDDTGDKVAIKLEHSYSMEDYSQLENEATLYKTLAGVGIPRVHWNGSVDDYKVMVFELLGPSLEELLDFCGGKFSLKTLLMIANQLIYRLGHIHSKQIIH